MPCQKKDITYQPQERRELKDRWIYTMMLAQI